MERNPCHSEADGPDGHASDRRTDPEEEPPSDDDAEDSELEDEDDDEIMRQFEASQARDPHGDYLLVSTCWSSISSVISDYQQNIGFIEGEGPHPQSRYEDIPDLLFGESALHTPNACDTEMSKNIGDQPPGTPPILGPQGPRQHLMHRSTESRIKAKGSKV